MLQLSATCFMLWTLLTWTLRFWLFLGWKIFRAMFTGRSIIYSSSYIPDIFLLRPTSHYLPYSLAFNTLQPPSPNSHFHVSILSVRSHILHSFFLVILSLTTLLITSFEIFILYHFTSIFCFFFYLFLADVDSFSSATKAGLISLLIPSIASCPKLGLQMLLAPEP